MDSHIQKARINVQDILANVMHAKYAELKSIAAQRRDLDLEIKSTMLPSHVHFLVCPFTILYVSFKFW